MGDEVKYKSTLELAMSYDAIPLSKRVRSALENKTEKVKAYDNWGTDLDKIVDPNTGFTALMVLSDASLEKIVLFIFLLPDCFC